MKKLLAALCALLLVSGCASNECPAPEPCPTPETPVVVELPAPRDTNAKYKNADGNEVACDVNSYAAACSSINAKNLHEYLGRDDVLYIDLRDFSDYSKKHLRNFECIPYFALIFDTKGAEDRVQLYSGKPAEPVATYAESDALLHALIPTDKTIFFMCQSGGRVAQMMTLLANKGYDMSKIYNVGGMGQYTSKELGAFTTNTEEVTVEANYSFSNLTRK